MLVFFQREKGDRGLGVTRSSQNWQVSGKGTHACVKGISSLTSRTVVGWGTQNTGAKQTKAAAGMSVDGKFQRGQCLAVSV